MSDPKFLTADEVAERYRGEISLGTLRNWRSARIGPTFVKIGKAVSIPRGTARRLGSQEPRCLPCFARTTHERPGWPMTITHAHEQPATRRPPSSPQRPTRTYNNNSRLYDDCRLMHNHPSGDPTPSGEDIGMTAEIRRARRRGRGGGARPRHRRQRAGAELSGGGAAGIERAPGVWACHGNRSRRFHRLRAGDHRNRCAGVRHHRAGGAQPRGAVVGASTRRRRRSGSDRCWRPSR